ncbi:ABC transporter ATP-binding protein [Autumnicola edwardsiae]|uniref:ABC transporter ATP-binding protein n=1 Tax=Autumnicola edwardsiae TaxID=3075594 RepID=A0ABU3CWR9_9FLAO|nr:ABC transporter ATP-binding protein [Zunongwangia sp. F297]MDT0650822.1 ABC transporter ATP-binding protein [Zunongwangia sp. F297]
MSIILKAENISKQYRLGTVGTGTLSHDLNRWWHSVRGKEDPYLKVGSLKDRSAAAKNDYVWALQDINFEVKQGEVLGIIGKNGAGKSTLLKILSRVTAPTTGTIKTKGRIASLLEVGTGFHPELTGRENIYLNGAILGMTRIEVKSKIDEIIAFSGCEMYIDTPTKRYSSGMTVRLAFAVAAHLEPEILVVDEVLAVGDAEFQKKAIGKMHDISQGEGRTVLFVSHNMVAIQNLCSYSFYLENGEKKIEGKPSDVIDYYLNSQNLIPDTRYYNSDPKKDIYIKSFEITSEVATGKPFEFEAKVVSNKKLKTEFAFTLKGKESQPIFQIYSGHSGETFSLEIGENQISGKLDKLRMASGLYDANLWLGTSLQVFDFQPQVFNLLVKEGSIRLGGPISSKNGYPVIEDATWKKNE